MESTLGSAVAGLAASSSASTSSASAAATTIGAGVGVAAVAKKAALAAKGLVLAAAAAAAAAPPRLVQLAGVFPLACANSYAGWLAHDYCHGTDRFCNAMRQFGALAAGLGTIMWGEKHNLHHARTNEVRGLLSYKWMGMKQLKNGWSGRSVGRSVGWSVGRSSRQRIQ